MMKRSKFAFAALIFWPLIILNQNCTSRSATDPVTGAQATAASLSALELGSSSDLVGTDTVVSHLLKITSSAGEVSYAQWIPPLKPNVASPVVVVTAPYDAIAWSDSAVDQEWKTRTGGVSGAYPDVSGPNYNAATSKNISYFVTTPISYAQVWYPLIKSGIGIMITYGRFYAGGDMNVAIRGVGSSLDYLATLPSVDASRIGIFGISLGGLQAIYGSTASKIQPKVGVAWSALSDGPMEKAYVDQVPSRISNLTQATALTSFFEPYLRRMPDDLSTVTASKIVSKNSTHFLFIHDDWDMLVPSSEGRTVEAMFGSKGEGFWFPHLSPLDRNTAALDHQQSSEGIVGSMAMTFAQAYLEANLIPASEQINLFALYTARDIAKQFNYFRAQQRGGNNVQTLVPRLIDLCDSRMNLVDIATGTYVTGPRAVASILQTYWGASTTTVNSGNVKTYLQQNGLPK